MTISSEKLIKMKEMIDQAKTKSAELGGQLKSQMKTLQDEFGFKSLKDAEDGLKKMDKDLVKMETELDKGVAKLEKDYEW